MPKSRGSSTWSVIDWVLTDCDHVENGFDHPKRDVSWDYQPVRNYNQDPSIGYNSYHPYDKYVAPMPHGVGAGPSTDVHNTISAINPSNEAVDNNNNIDVALNTAEAEVNVIHRFVEDACVLQRGHICQ